MLRSFRLVSLSAALLAAGSVPAAAQVTIGTATTGNCYPFICAAGDGFFRYQQVYTSTAFSPVGFINSLTFYRTIAGPGDFDGNTYALSLSTTSQAVGGLSDNPTANLGANNTLFWTGVLSGAIGSSFTLTGTPFLYMPGMGNLLLDVMISGPNRVPNHSGNTYLDADDTGAETSRAYGSDLFVYTDATGLVTTFGVSATVIPEPSSIALLGTGLLGLAALARRKLGRKDRHSAA